MKKLFLALFGQEKTFIAKKDIQKFSSPQLVIA